MGCRQTVASEPNFCAETFRNSTIVHRETAFVSLLDRITSLYSLSLMKKLLLAALCALALPVVATAQEWSLPVGGSWVRVGATQPGDVVLANNGRGCEI